MGGGPRKKWLSDSAHPKEARKKYPGAGPTKLRNGVPTHVNSRDSVCVRCHTDVPAETGWLLVLPRGNGVNGSQFAVMCRTCGG